MSIPNIPKGLRDGSMELVSKIPGLSSEDLTAAAIDQVIMYPKEPDKATGILANYRDLINGTPALLSLLYDADMLPEQIVTVRGAITVAAVCEAYKIGKGSA